VVAGKAVCFEEALHPSFRKYQEQIIKNAATLGSVLQEHGLRLVTGGTDNHLLVVDLRSRDLTGIQATRILDRVGITVNNNQIPFDPLPPMKSSGIRIGTPAMTSRGLCEAEMRQLGHLIVSALDHADDEMRMRQIREQTLDLADRFPVYPGILRRLYEQDRGAYDF
jgi:glycine hydroxymethyltransferase